MTIRGPFLAAVLAVGGLFLAESSTSAQFYFGGTFGNRVGVNVQVGSPYGGGFYPGVGYSGYYPAAGYGGLYSGGFGPSYLPPPALPGPPPPPPLYGPGLPAVPAYGGATYLYQSQYPAYNAWGSNYSTYRLGYYR